MQRSKAEFGVAKHTYVAHRSGWFSDRTECYLAAGRVRRWSRIRAGARTCPPARGCWRSRRPTRRWPAIDRINGDYARHARRAAEIAARALRRPARACRGYSTRSPDDVRPAAAHRACGASGHSIPPPRSGSVETMTSLLTDGLVDAGHDVTLFATAESHDARQTARHLRAADTAGSRRSGPGNSARCSTWRPPSSGHGVRHHPLRGQVLPDIAGLRASVADTDRANAAPCA